MSNKNCTNTSKSVLRFIWVSIIFSFVFAGHLFAAGDMQPVSFTDSPDPVASNAEVVYTIEFKNNTADDASNPELNVTVPKGFSYVRSDYSGCEYNGTNPSDGEATDIVHCTAASFGGLESADIDITLRAPVVNEPTVFEANATASCDDDENTANNLEHVKTTVTKGADLNLTKTSMPNPAVSSGIVTYEMNVTNNGPHLATGLVLTDDLPGVLSFYADDASTAEGNDSNWSCSTSGQLVTCTGSDIPMGQTSSFHFRVKITGADTGTITNAATVISDVLEVNASDNTDTDDLTIIPGTDISVVKRVLTSPVIELQNVVFEINVSNLGQYPAENVVMEDILNDTGYTAVEVNASGWTCSIVDNNITCSKDDNLAVGESNIITIEATAPDISELQARTDENNVSVATTTDDPISTNDQDRIVYTVWADQADLELSKSKSPSPLAVGDIATSTINVHNNGPREADPVQVKDVLDENEAYDSYSGTDWNCSVSDQTVTCDYSQALAMGENAETLYIKTKILADDDNISNRACTGGSGESAEPTNEDTYTLNDCDRAGVSGTDEDIRGIADIRVIKTASDNNITPDKNSFTYTISIKNIEGNTSTDVKFRDRIPQYIEAFEGRPATGLSLSSNEMNVTNDCNITDGLVECDLGDMALGDEINISILVEKPMWQGTRTNTASAYSTEIGDINRTNNEDNATVTVEDIAEIELVSKIVTPDDVLAGTEVTYTLTIRNNGPSNAVDVNVSDIFSGKDFTFISANPTQGTCEFDEANRELNCSLDNMTYEDVQSITVKIRPDHLIPTPDNWEINNTARVTMQTTDSNLNNNEKNATLQVHQGKVDLAIEVDESEDFTEPVPFDPENDTYNYIVYKVKIDNYGPSYATDINFSAVVNSVSPDNDQNLTFLYMTAESNSSSDGVDYNCTEEGTTFHPDSSAPVISCSIGNLEAGDDYIRYLVFKIKNAPHYVSGDVYHIDSNVTSREVETLIGNNEEDEKTTVRIFTDPQIIKTVSETTVEVGQNFTYNLKVTNNGPGYSPETIVSDDLPAGMVLTGTPTISPAQGSCTGGNGDTSFTCRVDDENGTLHSEYGDPDGISEVNITVPVMVTTWTQEILNNIANVTTSGPDKNSSNNEDNVTITVLEPAHIGDKVWLDRDADGIQNHNSNDRNVAGIPVYLILDSNNSIVQTTVTDSSGLYGFDINHSDDYRVEFNITGTPYYIPPQNAGSDDAADSDINASGSTEVFTVNYGDNNLTIDAGLYTLVGIGDRVWVDENGNGLQDSGEANVSDVNVTLYKEGNSTAIDSNTTNADGRYQFDNLIPGRYHVVFDKTTLPSGYVFTTQNIGNYRYNSDPDRVTGQTINRLVRSNSNVGHYYVYRHLDAGIYIPASIGDYTWIDTDGNGEQNSSEQNLSDVNVTLMDAGCQNVITQDQNNSSSFSSSVLTDATGYYLFENLKPDTYCLRFVAPDGSDYVLTQDNHTDDQNDSDPDGFNTPEGNTPDYVLTSGEDNRSVDAGFYLQIHIGDRVWEDKNYNGIQDAGERNVSNVRVYLVIDSVLQDGNDGTTENYIDTNSSGEYLFNDLPPGHAYSVRFTNLPAGYKFTKQYEGSDDEKDSDANETGYASGATPVTVSEDENLTFDAGIYKPVVIGNYVWEDMDADGIQDDGARGIRDVNVTLVMDGNPTTVTTLTDASGYYTFNDLLPSHTYSVEFTAPVEYYFTSQNEGDDIKDSDPDTSGKGVPSTDTMYSGDSNVTLDAGLYQYASMGNRVWIDANGNGIQDGGEVGQDNVTVRLYPSTETSPDTGNALDTNTTDANGFYHFDNLRPGSYYVVVDKTTLPAEYVFTQKNAGTQPGTADSDVNLTTGRSDIVTLVSDQDDNSTDAGIYEPVEVGDRIWVDTNANGTQDSGEPNYNAEINVTLIDNNDQSNTYTVTTTNGDYNISNVKPGNYHLEFSLPTGYNVSPKDASADNNDSDVSGLRTDDFDLVTGVNQYTWDMGIYEYASIGDRIWFDLNGDGVQDTNENNVSDDVTVTLLDESNSTVGTQTVSNGSYYFTDVVPGEYHLRFEIPANYVVSPQDVNETFDDTVDSDINVTAVGANQYETAATTLISGENDPNWDAGIYIPATIGNFIWFDSNANGIQDLGEVGVSDINVTLFKVEDNGTETNIGTQMTGNDGNYTFTGLIPGDYYLESVTPMGYEVSPLNAGNDDSHDSDFNVTTNQTEVTTLQGSENDMSWDKGLYQLATIGDQVWIDSNGDGVQNDSETLDVNVTVVLHDTNGEVNRTTVTAGSSGEYLFEDLIPSEYHVEFIPQAGSGYVFIAPDQGGNDTEDSDVNVTTGLTPVEELTSGESNITLDAGIYVPATLGDRVWLDANADGIQDPNENNVSDINVTLYDATGATVGFTVTDENGSYTFTELVPGDYTVGFTLADNSGQIYVVTPQVGTQADANNSDINATGITATVTLVSGQNNPNIDAGLYIPVMIGDYVWSDFDRDGIQDTSELAIPGVRVTLYKENNTTAQAQMDTNSSGEYLFEDIAPGSYYVIFTQPEHFRPTVQNVGDDTNDSDADTTTGETAVFTVVSPEDNLTIDAGFYALATISGNVSEDANNDDIGDTNLEGVIITLFDNNGTQIAQTSTDSNGSYLFIDIEPGTYSIIETQPDGLVNVSENEGGADNDPGNTTLDNNISVTVGVGEIDISNDFVEEMGVDIGDRIWMDVNADGIQDSDEDNETVLENISLNLYRAGTYVSTTTTDEHGYYLFENYPEGNYSIEFNLTTLPEHYGVTKQDQGSDDTNDSDINATTFANMDENTSMTIEYTLLPGERNLNYDMGIYRLGTISGTIRVDMDGDDDVTGPNDDILPGVQIDLLDEDGNIVATTWTDANGYYKFIDVPQGTYTIREHQPDGYLDINSTDGDIENTDIDEITVIVGPGEDDTDNDFNEKLGGKIGDYVWNDTDADNGSNGIQDGDETGVNGVHVCLEDEDGNPIMVSDTKQIQRCTDTNATGYYEFVGLIPSDTLGSLYIVVFEIPNGTDLTPEPLAGNDIAVDSNPIETEYDTNGRLIAKAPIDVGIGEQNETIDMGLVYVGTAAIGDYIWQDKNRDGIQDPDEPGLDGVHVILYDENGRQMEEYITHSDGYYRFEHLYEGYYTVEFILPQDWAFTDEDSGNDTGDSDANPSTGKTVEIYLLEGQYQRIWDAGVYCQCEEAANSSDSGDAMNIFGIFAMMLMTGLIGLFFIRKEEELYV